MEVLLKREARSLGLQVTDDEVRDSILQIPSFHDGARFDRARYLKRPPELPYHPGGVRGVATRHALGVELEGLITDGLIASDQEVTDIYAFENEKVDVTFVKVPFSQFKETITVGDTEVADYYEKNRERFRKPRRSPLPNVPTRPSTSQRKCRSRSRPFRLLRRPQDDYEQPSGCNSSTSSSWSPLTPMMPRRPISRRRPPASLTAARSGGKAEFAELAKKNSEDSCRSKTAADLGTVARGALEAPLDEAAFALNVGDVSEPVASSRVSISSGSRKGAGGAKPLAEVHDEIVKRAIAQRRRRRRNALTPTSIAPAPATSLEELAQAQASPSRPAIGGEGQMIRSEGSTLVNSALVAERCGRSGDGRRPTLLSLKVTERRRARFRRSTRCAPRSPRPCARKRPKRRTRGR